MIPLAVSKRPIGGSALLLGCIGILFAVLGFPVDIAIFPPLVYMVLVFGVFAPMVEGGLESISSVRVFITAISCVVTGIVFFADDWMGHGSDHGEWNSSEKKRRGACRNSKKQK